MLAKIGDALDSEFVSLGHSGPQHLRIVGGQKLSGSIDVKTSKNAAVALLCASLLNRGRTTLRYLARIEEVNRILEVLASIGVRTRWLPGTQRPRDHPARDARPRAHRRRRGPPHAHRHHVPRPAAALARELPAAVCRWLRPRHPHRRAAPVGAARLRPPGDGDARLLRGPVGPLRQPGARHRPHRARRHRDRERPHGGGPPRRHHGDPQRQPQLHGAGPLLLPREARRRASRASARRP